MPVKPTPGRITTDSATGAGIVFDQCSFTDGWAAAETHDESGAFAAEACSRDETPAADLSYSHSIVLGGLEETS
jgi:hypothetical protein